MCGISENRNNYDPSSFAQNGTKIAIDSKFEKDQLPRCD